MKLLRNWTLQQIIKQANSSYKKSLKTMQEYENELLKRAREAKGQPGVKKGTYEELASHQFELLVHTGETAEKFERLLARYSYDGGIREKIIYDWDSYTKAMADLAYIQGALTLGISPPGDINSPKRPWVRMEEIGKRFDKLLSKKLANVS